MDKLKYVKLEKTDGSYTSQIPIGADAANIDMANGTNLENRVKSIEDDIDLQTARIDELSTLEPGSTTGDAELADIRVAADGTIYDNAGNSVRGQINQVNDAIEETKDIIEDNTLIYDATIKNLPKTEEQEGTELEFDDAIESPIMHYNEEGNLEKGLLLNPSELEQDTTQGNQLVDFNNLAGSTATSTFSNDILTLSNSAGAYTSKFYNITDLYKNNSGKTLKFRYKSIDISNQYGGIVQLTITYNDDTPKTYLSMLTHNLVENARLIPSDTSNIYSVTFNIYSNNSETDQAASVTIEEPMLYFDDNDTYEPYTNGASPNPDYPQEVKKIWGDNELRIINRNWFNFKANPIYNNVVQQITILDNGIRLGNSTGTYRYVIYLIGKTKNLIGKTIRLKGNVSINGTQRTCNYSLGFCNKRGLDRNQKVVGGDNTEISMPVTSAAIESYEYIYVGLFLTSGVTIVRDDYTDFTNMMLTVDDENMEYISHKEKVLPLNLGVKNLFDFNNTVYQAANKATITKQDKGFKVESSDSAYAYCGISITNFNLKPNTTYTASCKVKSTTASSGSRIGVFSSFNTTGSVLYSEYVKAGICYIAFTTPNEIPATGILFVLYVGAGDSEAIFEDIQLEEGPIAHSYSPYGQEPVEYCAIEDYKDEFFYNSSKREDYIDTLENNKWYLKKNTKKVVLDGSERYSKSSTNIVNAFILSDYLQIGKIFALSDYFRYKKQANVNLSTINHILYNTSNNQTYMVFDINASQNSVANLKAWLTENNVVVYYPLETPEYILLNDTLQSQLNAIRNVITLSSEQVYIIQDNEQLSFNLKGLLNSSLNNKINEIDNTFDNIDEEQTEQNRRLNVLETVIDGLPKIEGEGTDIQLKNTIAGPLKIDLEPSELEQETTTGKNLFNTKLMSNFTPNTVGWWSLDGINSFYTTSQIKKSEIYYDLKANITYTLSIYYKENISTTANSPIQLIASDATVIPNSSILQGETSSTFTPTVDVRAYPRINCASADVTTQCIVQLEVGSTATEYEPYTGEIASPNPDYPQEVKRIWGDNNIEISNSNLISVKNVTSTSYGVTFTCNKNGEIILNGTATNNIITRVFLDKAPLKLSAGTYTLSANNTGSISAESGSVTNTVLRLANTSGSISGLTDFQVPLQISNNFKTANLEQDGEYLVQIRINSGTILNNFIIKPQLEKNNEKTDFIKNERQLFPLNLGVKNLFDKDNITIGKWLENNGVENTNDAWAISDYIKIIPNKNFTTSGFLNGSGSYPSRCYYDANKNFISGVEHANLTKFIDTAPTNAYYMKESIRNIDLNTIMIEEGDVAHSYSEYGVEPIEYCAIGDYKDEFFYNSSKREDYIDTLEDGKWYLKKNTKKIVLDGSENWQTQSSVSPYVYRIIIKDYLRIENTSICLCSHYISAKNGGYSNLTDGQCGFRFSNSDDYNYFYVRTSIFPTIDEFKASLSNNNVKLYYVLATPEYILLNDTLQKQLTDIAKVLSYNEETNISQENNELSFNIKANAILDINSKLQELENAILSLGNNT